ncbi:hypothetical protein Syun_012563 [Stephania yunnanensis]|uniref:Bifunctional inhibitor/plant lipid transfer protein/seed storage helical domain-containing protein n=1 Tax=Stephania yunnanensis TaxID=152371 RepID=A0AAP0K118_9MAGN
MDFEYPKTSELRHYTIGATTIQEADNDENITKIFRFTAMREREMGRNTKTSSSLAAALFLSLNLLSFTMVSTCRTCPANIPPKPNPTPSTATPSSDTPKRCPKDTLKLGVCAKLLGGAVDANVGNPPYHPCCTYLQGLVDLEAAVCLCTAIKANIIGIILDIPISLTLLINTCGKTLRSEFVCG